MTLLFFSLFTVAAAFVPQTRQSTAFRTLHTSVSAGDEQVKGKVAVPKSWPFAPAASKAVADAPAAKGNILTQKISYDEVRAALKAWTEGIIDIGKVYQEEGDYKAKVLCDALLFKSLSQQLRSSHP